MKAEFTNIYELKLIAETSHDRVLLDNLYKNKSQLVIDDRSLGVFGDYVCEIKLKGE